MYLKQTKKKNKYRKKILFGSFRLHYNWCSSSAHVLPIPSPAILETFCNTTPNNIYYDSTWNSAYATEEGDDHQGCKSNNGNGNGNGKDQEEEGQLSSYLQWLEEKGCNNTNLNEEDVLNNEENEIDKLADMFIANCHEKFRLEKIESYRRYQELLARTL